MQTGRTARHAGESAQKFWEAAEGLPSPRRSKRSPVEVSKHGSSAISGNIPQRLKVTRKAYFILRQ